MAHKNDPLSQLDAPKPDPAITKLTESVCKLVNDMDTLKKIASFKGVQEKIDEPVLRELWNLVYTTLIRQIFEKGPAFYNNKQLLLMQSLQLAVTRADEAVDAYVQVRNSFPDPVVMAQERWAREKLAGL